MKQRLNFSNNSRWFSLPKLLKKIFWFGKEISARLRIASYIAWECSGITFPL
jgi:hypothetical protein